MEKQIFQFANYNVPVEIAGHEFTMDCSSDTGDYLKEMANALREIAQDVAAGKKNRDDIIAYGSKAIDHLLGEGTYNLILAGRPRKVNDVMDLCMFLTEVAAKFHAERQSAQHLV